jgi:hypothetical protein
MEARRQVKAAVEEFNKYRGSEAVARLIEFSEDQVKIGLSGPFCRSCGLYDYFDDLKMELEDKMGCPIEISKIEGGESEGYLITYRKRVR